MTFAPAVVSAEGKLFCPWRITGAYQFFKDRVALLLLLSSLFWRILPNRQTETERQNHKIMVQLGLKLARRISGRTTKNISLKYYIYIYIGRITQRRGLLPRHRRNRNPHMFSDELQPAKSPNKTYQTYGYVKYTFESP